METCESCRFYFPVDKSGNQGECRLEPPKLFVFPKAPPIAGAPPLIELRSLFPPVKSGAWCGRYEKGAGPLEITEDDKTIKLTEVGKAKYIASCSLARLTAMRLNGQITSEEVCDERKRRKER